MPIHYACVLNSRNVVVLQGVYEKSGTIFRTQVVQNANRIQRYSYTEAALDSNLRILYHNWDTATAAIVISHEVDKQECGQFLENFKNNVEVHILGRRDTGYEQPMNASREDPA